ncbi:MAG: LLM class flavin-dependent oxidoreductase [Pseudomonadales bacterium]|jgi:alkanesulfonate monooxygenase SsuD/methylene tetrahydromethanopterin reductase-like flavin-dependent oxidoreductase (luciferase family)|nr:LLM class flavin-dependent oxidoreductase [Pseudomonadales bacterium]
MQFGVLTLGDWMAGPDGDDRPTRAERFARIVRLAERAEALGFDAFHVGEHHLCDYIVSSPQMLLAAISQRTERIRLSTGVTLVANRDPVHLAEDYASLDLLSAGRAEMIAGRGNAFFDAYLQFGQQLDDSRERFGEHLELMLRLWREERVSFEGDYRAPLCEVGLEPRPARAGGPTVWLGGGSSTDSADMAARLGLPLQLPGVFAGADAFAGLAEHYRRAWSAAAHAGAPRIGFTAHCFVGPDGDAARDYWAPWHLGYQRWVWALICAQSGREGPPPIADRHAAFEDAKRSPALCGDPEEVAGRIVAWHGVLKGIDRLVLKFDGGNLPEARVHDSLELFSREVMPRVRKAIA